MPRLTVIVLCGFLTACGFHLKGARPLPTALDSVSVVHENAYSVERPPLVESLERRLRARGALASADAGSTLRIRSVDEREQILAVSPVDGRAVAFQLQVSATFEFRTREGAFVASDSVSVERNFSFDNTQRLAAEAERRELLESMQSDLADMILLRIETVLQDRASG